jgi:hypothetical protein
MIGIRHDISTIEGAVYTDSELETLASAEGIVDEEAISDVCRVEQSQSMRVCRLPEDRREVL